MYASVVCYALIQRAMLKNIRGANLATRSPSAMTVCDNARRRASCLHTMTSHSEQCWSGNQFARGDCRGKLWINEWTLNKWIPTVCWKIGNFTKAWTLLAILDCWVDAKGVATKFWEGGGGDPCAWKSPTNKFRFLFQIPNSLRFRLLYFENIGKSKILVSIQKHFVKNRDFWGTPTQEFWTGGHPPPPSGDIHGTIDPMDCTAPKWCFSAPV